MRPVPKLARSVQSARLSALGFLLCLGTVGSPLTAQQTQQFRLGVDQPGDPVHLEVNVHNGSIHVVGDDGTDIRVEYTEDTDAPGAPVRQADGTYRIRNVGSSVRGESRGNRAEIHAPWGGPPVNVEIRLPRRAELILRSNSNGDIRVENITGSVEAYNTNDDVQLDGIRGSVVAHTTTGDLIVELLESTPASRSSIVAWHGDIVLLVPSDLDADFEIAAGSEELVSELPVRVLPPLERPVQRSANEFSRERTTRFRTGDGAEAPGGVHFHAQTRQGEFYLRDAAKRGDFMRRGNR